MRRLVSLGLLVVLLTAACPPCVSGQGGVPAIDVDSLLARMSPAQKVGQLVLVSFPGETVPPGSGIANLIQDYYIGGVLLSAEDGNYGADRDAGIVQSLVSQLQTLTFSPSGTIAPNPTPQGATPAASDVATPEAGTSPTPQVAPVAIPLFVAMRQEDLPWLVGESGLSPQMSLMGIGGTWSTEVAERMGALAGKELEALGVNVLFGPALDLANAHSAGTSADLSTRSFGESPFWVGLLGRAYVQGLRAGAQGRLLSVATHFPGLGAANRDVAEEVPVVQGSLAGRLDTDLLPFLRAMAPAGIGQADWVDGLLVTHVQFRDISEDLQATKPASLDPQMLAYVLDLPEVSAWRSAGGLLVSDSLGMTSVKRFYDPQMATFQAKRVAYDAFLAGNDLLCLDAFGLSGGWEEHFDNIRVTLEFLQLKYTSDLAFRSRVDESVRRILVAKQKLYPRFSLESIVGDSTRLEEVGRGSADVYGAAVDAVTLVYPEASDLLTSVPALPSPDEHVVVFEDVRATLACEQCAETRVPTPGTVVSLLQSLYGEEGSGQIDSAKTQGYSFSDLWGYLNLVAESETGALVQQPVGEALAEADWLLFLTQGLDASAPPEAGALLRLLREHSVDLSGKRIAVIACGAPYYLDATDMAKISVLYAVYAPNEVAIEAGLRALFREYTPSGRAPVSVPGVGYEIATQLRPAPQQILSIEPVGMPATGEPGVLNIGLGDELALQTGSIFDNNGHIVPDGTVVAFLFSYPDSQLAWEQRAATVNGKAQTRVQLDTPGTLLISVSCGEASLATTLRVTVLDDQPAVVSTVPPPTPTMAAPEPTSAGVFPGVPETPGPEAETRSLDLAAFLLMISGLLGVCALVWVGGHLRGLGLHSVEIALLVFCFGIVGYLCYGLFGLLANRMPVFVGGAWEQFSWRWQPAVAAWLSGGIVGVVGVAWPGFAVKVARLGRGSKT